MSNDEAKSIFFDLLSIPPEQQQMYIDRVCAQNETLKIRVQRLLDAHLLAGNFLGETIDTLGLPEPGEDDTAPEKVGPYRVLRSLGQGGFGTVYLCQQETPIERLVAVKVLRPGMDTRSVLRRFEDERILLSKMDHPGIARVLDAGKTESGQPYISMEYIEGETITNYCDTKRLGLHERLAVFAQVCQAIQHAHQKGVIHRDIKPGNVLVSEVDGRASVKVIDFGVSKAFEDQRAEDTVTRTMQLVGTPQYMSPEQASTVSSDIDTRTDVYSLGVLLYELTTGQPPFDPQKLRSASVGQLERMIRDIDPPRPSSRVLKLDDASTERVSTQRDSSIGLIVRELKGEIDWVIMKAMDKDRERRYPTAYALYEDIDRVTRGEVVQARPPSTTYGIRKFVRRNTASTLVAVLALASLIAITGLSLRHARRIEAANERIESSLHVQEQVLAFTEEMLGGIDPAVARGQDTALFRMILETANERVGSELAGSPEVEVRVRVLIGNLYRSIGDFDQALGQFKAATAIGVNELGKEHWQAIDARIAMGVAHAELAQYDQAKVVLEEALDDSRSIFGENHPDSLMVLSNLANVYNSLGDNQRALQTNESLLAARVEVLGSDHEETMSTRNSLALALMGLDKYDRAKGLLETTLAHQTKNLGDDHPKSLKTRTNLALIYHELGLFEQAVEMNTAILEQKKLVLGDSHPSVLVSMANTAGALKAAGNVEQSRDLLIEALSISRETLGDEHQYTLILGNNLSSHYYEQRDYAAALELVELSSAGLAKSLGDSHPMTLQARGNLADILLDMGSHVESLELALDLEVSASELFELTDRRLGMFSERIGKCYTALGRDAEARAYYLKAAEIYEGTHGVDSEQYLRVISAADIDGSGGLIGD